MPPENAPTFPVDVTSQTVTSTVDKPAEMREAKKLRSLATAVTRRVRSLPRAVARSREHRLSEIPPQQGEIYEYPKDNSNELSSLRPYCGIACAAGEDGL